MHSEWFEVPQATVDAIAACRARGGKVMAVGTTSLRALESAAATNITRTSILEGPDARPATSPWRLLPFLEVKTLWHPTGF